MFFHTKAQKVNFLTAQYCTYRSLRNIRIDLEKVIEKYNCWGFNVTDINADNKFDRDAINIFLQPTLLHIYGREEHVGFIKRSIRTFKEQIRSTCSSIPF